MPVAGYCDHLNNDLKARRAEMRGVAKSLELAYPNSSSIKHGLTITLMPAKVKRKRTKKKIKK